MVDTHITLILCGAMWGKTITLQAKSFADLGQQPATVLVLSQAKEKPQIKEKQPRQPVVLFASFGPQAIYFTPQL